LVVEGEGHLVVESDLLHSPDAPLTPAGSGDVFDQEFLGWSARIVFLKQALDQYEEPVGFLGFQEDGFRKERPWRVLLERKRKAEDRHASARPGQSLSPRCRSQSPRSAERKSVIHVSGRFCWVKVNGQWLYKTRQIVTGRNKHPARWMLWRPNRRAQIPSALRSAKPIRWRIR